MKEYLSGVRRFVKHRASGENRLSIRYAEKNVEAANKISKSIPDDNFWAAWFINYLRSYLKLIKKSRFIPGRYMHYFGNPLEETLSKITENNKLKLKDIELPIPLDPHHGYVILFMISDSLLPYLLGDIDDELYYALMDLTSEGPYEYKDVRLEEGDIVIDAGANIGDFSALAGVKGCKTYAFEPMPNVIDSYLSKTAKWNPNITICKYALSNKAEELFFDESFSGSSFVKTLENSNKVKVQAIDLDSFAQENNLPRVDFIKADIEGAERYMLMGAKRVLKEFAPKIAICTYHLPDDPKVLRELILEANPNYVIEERWKKMFAYVPKDK